MTRCFAKVSEEEIVAINEAVFFCPSDLVNTKTTIPLSGLVKSGGYNNLDALRFGIYPPLFTSPSGDRCILLSVSLSSFIYHHFYLNFNLQEFKSNVLFVIVVSNVLLPNNFLFSF